MFKAASQIPGQDRNGANKSCCWFAAKNVVKIETLKLHLTPASRHVEISHFLLFFVPSAQLIAVFKHWIWCDSWMWLDEWNGFVFFINCSLILLGQHCWFWRQPVGDLLSGQCRDPPGPKFGLSWPTQGLSELFLLVCFSVSFFFSTLSIHVVHESVASRIGRRITKTLREAAYCVWIGVLFVACLWNRLSSPRIFNKVLLQEVDSISHEVFYIKRQTVFFYIVLFVILLYYCLALLLQNEAAFDEVFQRANFNTFVFRNRVKLETYNVSLGEKNLPVTVWSHTNVKEL